VSIDDTAICYNQALGGDGQVGGNGFGGGLYVDRGASVTVSASDISHNQADGGDGDDGGNGFGGGLYVAAGATVNVRASDISHNRADGGEGGDGGSDGLGIGGGVYNLGTFLADDATVIRHNHASTSYDDCFGC
jgi:hypothetical protein